MDRAAAKVRSFPLLGFVGALLGFSLGLNAFLALKVYRPRLWQDLQLAMIRPPELRSDDHVRGPAGAPVTVIEYSDFQCPFCAQIHPSLARLADEGKIKWAFRHYPLFTIHPLAAAAAEAAECAGEQGKFWEYTDVVFAGQHELHNEKPWKAFLLDDAAGRVGVDGQELGTCISSARFAERVRTDLEEALSQRIDATPTFFVNGKRYQGALTVEELEQLVQSGSGR